MDTVKVKVPVLARLILSELAERRGVKDEELLTDLIRREAVAELGRPTTTDQAALSLARALRDFTAGPDAGRPTADQRPEDGAR